MIKTIAKEHSFLLLDLNNRVFAQSQYPIGRAWTLQQIEDSLTMGVFGFAKWHENKILAYIFLRDLGGAWEIEFLATDPAHRKQGLMQELMAFVELKLPKETDLWLEVHEKNLPAQRFYERNGFCKVGERPSYYYDGGGAVLFSKPAKAIK